MDATQRGSGVGVRTFLIGDIRGYTRFTQEHGDAQAARLAKKFADLARDAVEARGGRVIELRGDEALAVFVSTAQAVRAALELQATCTEETAGDPTLPLTVGIGIDAGEAIPVEDGFRGAALNTAARLCSRAVAGQVLVTRAVAELARDGDEIDFREVGAAELKGFEAAIDVIEALPASPLVLRTMRRQPEATSSPEVLLPSDVDVLTPLIDREHEMHWLRGTWRSARRGHGRVVFVSGPSQIGKTRLLAELASQVAATGDRVHYAGPGGTAAAQAVAAIRAAAEAVDPVLVVLDDLDIAGEEAARALDEAIDRIASRPTLVAGVVKDPNAAPDFARLIERADRSGDGHARLAPLDVRGVEEITRLYVGDAVRDVPLESMARASEGVPGRVHEVVSEWARDEAGRRLAAAAQWLAEGSGRRSADLDFANNVIKLRLGRLFVRDGDAVSDPGAEIPYKGLASFNEKDTAYFFGRERLVGELAARTVGMGLLGVLGASGSGKSSVIAAGLLPSLRAGLLPGSERWTAVTFRPGEHPMAELRVAIEQAGTAGRIVVCVDQFEEVFTLCADDAERDAFIRAVTELATRDPERAVVVPSIRDDFYGSCAPYREFAELISANHVLVPPMTSDELRRAIELPARRVRLRVESALVDALVAEVEDEPGGLPLLSAALVELCQAREDGWLRMSAYERTGGVRGAVARLAEASYEQLSGVERQVARRVLLRLGSTDAGDGLTRRRVHVSEFDIETDPVAADVLDRLTRDRLLTMSDSTVEVAHEALLREWPRLRGWLEEDVQGHQLHQHITTAAKQWDGTGRDDSELYRGARLSAALDWSATRGADLNELERGFLADSRRASEREAEKQRRTNRRLRGMLAGVAVFLVVALLAGGLAVVQRGRARRQADIARSREIASSAISVLDQDPELTILLAIEAKKAAPGEALPPRLVSALHEAVRSMRTVMSRRWDPKLPLTQIDGVLSPDASLVAVSGRRETLQAWDAATGKLAWQIRDDVGAGWFSHPEFSPDGSVLAVAFNRYWTPQKRVEGGRATGIYLIKPRSGELVRRIPPSSKCDWVDLPSGNAFTPDGELITVADPSPCRDGKLRLEFVDLDSKRVTRRVPVTSVPQVENEGPRPFLFAGMDSRHGRLFVSDGEENVPLSASSTRMIDLSSGKVLWERQTVNGFLSPDGSVMALSRPAPTDRAVELVDPATGETVRFLSGQNAGTADVGFSDDGRLAYTAGLDGTARVWDTRTGSNLINLTGEKHGLLGLSADDKGKRLATFGSDGTARVWDLTSLPLGETALLDLSPMQIGIRAIDAAGGVAAVMALGDPNAPAIVFDPATSKIIHRFPDHAGQVLALTPDGRAIVDQRFTRYGNNIPPFKWVVGPIAVRNAATGAIENEFEGLCNYVDPVRDCPHPPDKPYAEWILGISVTPDGRRAAAGGDSSAVSVWDLGKGSLLATLGPYGKPGSSAVTGVAIHPDGSKVAVLVSDEHPRVTILKLDRTVLAELPSEPPAVSSGQIAFSPDGSLLAAGGSRLKVFDTKNWKVLWQADAHDGGVFHLDYSPDSRSIVTTGPDGFVRLWDAREGRLIQAVPLGEDYGKAVAFTDDRHVLVGTLKGLVVGITFDTQELLRIGRSRVTRRLTDQECRTYLRLEGCR